MSLVLVTGISGYAASYVAQELLEQGYTVRGTVRNVKKADGVRKLFEGKKVELVEVPDIAQSDMTEAMQGVQFVMHVASPYHFKINDPKKDMLDPAVKGTINTLEYALEARVKHVVITSSFAAVTNLLAGGPFRDYTYTAEDWNPATTEMACEPGRPGPFVYSASKKLAEKAAWSFHEQHPQMAITTINPPMIYGPPIQATSSAEELNTSSATIYALLQNLRELPDDRLPLFCAVQDVAKAHVAALQNKAAQNKRLLICADEPFTWRMVRTISLLGQLMNVKKKATEFLKKEMPELSDRLPPVPQEPAEQRTIAKLDCSLAKNDLGLKFKPWQEMLTETVQALLKLEKQWNANESSE